MEEIRSIFKKYKNRLVFEGVLKSLLWGAVIGFAVNGEGRKVGATNVFCAKDVNYFVVDPSAGNKDCGGDCSAEFR